MASTVLAGGEERHTQEKIHTHSRLHPQPPHTLLWVKEMVHVQEGGQCVKVRLVKRTHKAWLFVQQKRVAYLEAGRWCI
jgi:hypothetical protein